MHKAGSRYYRATSRLSQDYFKRKGAKAGLLPGMMATAEIRTDRKSVLSLVLKPFAELTQTGGSGAIAMLEGEISALLAKQPLFAGLDSQECEAFARCGEAESYSIGKCVCHQGDPGDAVYLVYAGKLRVVRDP